MTLAVQNLCLLNNTSQIDPDLSVSEMCFNKQETGYFNMSFNIVTLDVPVPCTLNLTLWDLSATFYMNSEIGISVFPLDNDLTIALLGFWLNYVEWKLKFKDTYAPFFLYKTPQ